MRRADLTLLVLGAFLLLAGPLHVPSIWTRGEAREGLIVRDVVEHGHWVIAWRDGTLASKPPLFHWIAAGVGALAGVSDAVVRLPSAVGALVVAAVTLWLGTAVGGRATGWLAVGALAGTASFWRSATEARVDMVFAAAITVALGGFFVWWRDGRRAGRALFWMGLAAAVLTKGPAGGVLGALVVTAFLAVERDLRRLFALASTPWLAAALAVTAGWYVAAWRAAGAQFLAVQVLHENVNRLVGGGAFHHTFRHATKLPAGFVVHLLPWNLVLVSAARRWWRGEREDAAGHFLHAWWMGITGVFVFAARTRTVYLLPAYPAIALLAARALAPRVSRRLAAAMVALALGLLAAVEADRVYDARREPLVALAARIAPLVPPDATLAAAPALPENDALVLRWLLHRAIPRRTPLACEPGTYVIATGNAGARAAAAGLQVVATLEARRKGLLLLGCPGD